VLAGVEGGLLELTSTDGAWQTRDAIDARWLYLSDGDDSAEPYAYIRAIAPLSPDGRHVLFGGTLNGTNEELMLFETNADGTSASTSRRPWNSTTRASSRPWCSTPTTYCS
jgi:hypothetical protein